VKSYLMGIDLGAGSLKATIITQTGEIVGEASQPVTTHIPHPGWSEQDPDEWLYALRTAIPASLAAAGIRNTALAGIGLSAGAHIPVLTDSAGHILRPAILWSDQRASAEAAALHARAGAKIIETALNRVNPTWTLAMLAWLAAHEPEIVARTHRLYLAKDFLRHALTGTFETDVSDAIGTLLADNATKTWSPELCALIDWNILTLPPVKPATATIGAVTAEAAAATGLAAGTPVVTGANDTTVELLAAGAIRPGQATVKLATAAVLSQVTAGPRVEPPISCYPHIIAGLYYTATGTNSCASAHRWLRDTVFPGRTYAEMDALAATIPPGAGGLLFHPYLQGERAPYWDARLRADFIGLTMSHTPAHLARAFYEGIAFSIRDLIAASPGQDFLTIRLLGGGAASATWRQIIADVTGRTIELTESADASFGAALVAGIGAGVFASVQQAVADCVRLADTATPDPKTQQAYAELFNIYKAAQAALTPINHRLSSLRET
jgi:xylulokinase